MIKPPRGLLGQKAVALLKRAGEDGLTLPWLERFGVKEATLNRLYERCLERWSDTHTAQR